jgi:hypothetical protein
MRNVAVLKPAVVGADSSIPCSFFVYEYWVATKGVNQWVLVVLV